VLKRLADRQEQLQKRQQRLQWQRLAALHDQASWSLLSDAAVGRLNERALTELQTAWNDTETLAMLEDDRLALLLTRSLWTVQMSAAALPQVEPLAELARQAKQKSQEMMTRTAGRLVEQPEEPLLWTAVLTSLVAPETLPPQVVLNAAESVARQAAADATLVQLVAQSLLQHLPTGDLQQQVSAAQSTELPPETVVLTALACQRAGGETWTAFRANSSDWLGRQPLPGEVVVLISRLEQSSFD
jgi:hypothetical protein